MKLMMLLLVCCSSSVSNESDETHVDNQDISERITSALSNSVEKGLIIFKSKACESCHNEKSEIAPSLTGFSRRDQIAGTVKNTTDNLRIWLKNPQAVKPGTMMPNLYLSDDDVEVLIAYLQTL